MPCACTAWQCTSHFTIALIIGPLQLGIDVVQNHHAGEKGTHWDKTNKKLTSFKNGNCFCLVNCLLPVRLLLFSMAVVNHVNGYTRRVYCTARYGIEQSCSAHRQDTDYYAF